MQSWEFIMTESKSNWMEYSHSGEKKNREDENTGLDCGWPWMPWSEIWLLWSLDDIESEQTHITERSSIPQPFKPQQDSIQGEVLRENHFQSLVLLIEAIDLLAHHHVTSTFQYEHGQGTVISHLTSDGSAGHFSLCEGGPSHKPLLALSHGAPSNTIPTGHCIAFVFVNFIVVSIFWISFLTILILPLYPTIVSLPEGLLAYNPENSLHFLTFQIANIHPQLDLSLHPLAHLSAVYLGLYNLGQILESWRSLGKSHLWCFTAQRRWIKTTGKRRTLNLGEMTDGTLFTDTI